jgi:SAM-dependent methyltransferase
VDTLSTASHWDSREGDVRARLPSRLNIGVRDITDLLGRNIRPGDHVLEIGCAPGKYLSWCGIAGRAHISGVEYAPRSFRKTVNLFAAMDIAADVRCEDIFETSFADGSFDLVYSLGLIEHFNGDRAVEIVRKHVALLKPGGKAVIVIPNFSGWYGALMKRNDAEVYATHNIDMMNEAALLALAPEGTIATAYRYGCLTPWIVTFGIPRNPLARAAMYGINLVGLLQPFKSAILCPWLVLEVTRA